MDWVCSGCGRHFNWSVSECPHCRFQTTITTGGTQPTDTQQLKAKIEQVALEVLKEWVVLHDGTYLEVAKIIAQKSAV